MEKNGNIEHNKLLTISWLHFTAVWFFCIGFIVLLMGLLRIYALEHPAALKDISLSDLRTGIYIKDEVDHLAVSWYEPPGGGLDYNGCYMVRLSGILGSEVTEYYVVSIGAGSEYISLLVPEQKSEPFGKMTNDPSGERVAFTARIVKLHKEYTPNYPFMENAIGASAEELESYFSLRYGIRIIEEEKEKLLWLKGMALMVVSAFLWLAGNLSKGTYTLEIRNGENGKQK